MIRLTTAGIALLVATAIGTLAIVAMLTTAVGQAMLAVMIGMVL
jgi:hypothetical protein